MTDTKKTKTYYVRDGHRHGRGTDDFGVRSHYEAGDAVELTPTQFAAFRDKFETAEEHNARRRVKDAAPKAAEQGSAEEGKAKNAHEAATGNKAGASQTAAVTK